MASSFACGRLSLSTIVDILKASKCTLLSKLSLLKVKTTTSGPCLILSCNGIYVLTQNLSCTKKGFNSVLLSYISVLYTV